MNILKYGFPSETPLGQAMNEALLIASVESGVPQNKLQAEDITTPEHTANGEILIRVTEKEEE